MVDWNIKQMDQAIEYLSEEIAKEKDGYSLRLQSLNIAVEAIQKQKSSIKKLK